MMEIKINGQGLSPNRSTIDNDFAGRTSVNKQNFGVRDRKRA